MVDFRVIGAFKTNDLNYFYKQTIVNFHLKLLQLTWLHSVQIKVKFCLRLTESFIRTEWIDICFDRLKSRCQCLT